MGSRSATITTTNTKTNTYADYSTKELDGSSFIGLSNIENHGGQISVSQTDHNAVSKAFSLADGIVNRLNESFSRVTESYNSNSAKAIAAASESSRVNADTVARALDVAESAGESEVQNVSGQAIQLGIVAAITVGVVFIVKALK